MTRVTTTEAIAYRGHRRRFLTLRGACRDKAKAIVNEALGNAGYTTRPVRGANPAEEDWPEPEKWARLVAFMAKVYELDFKRLTPTGRDYIKESQR